MTNQTYIFIGRSGSGKGTQAQLLMDAIKKKDPKAAIMYVQTGQELREFIKGDKFTQKKAKVVYDEGGLMPEFLVIYQWVKIIVEKFTGKENLIFDGTPRKIHEAGVLHSIFSFFRLQKPWVINLDISYEQALKRLLLRKRQDDNEEDIKQRLGWYETEVVKVIEFFKNSPEYNFVKIDGEGEIADIHNDIVKKVNLV